MIRWLAPNDPADAFPSPAQALREPNGLLAAGGDLSPDRLLNAYRSGIFPWYEEGQPILWWSPDPRCVLVPQELHISRSLRRTLARGRFQVSMDTAFAEVVEACAQPRRYGGGTWITDAMARAYATLHRLGWAHSVETWRERRLVGGLYGVAIGRVFFGESMFSHESDASKVALVETVRHLQQLGFALIDCQLRSSHIESLGARPVPRKAFLRQLDTLCEPPGHPRTWTRGAAPTAVAAGPGN